MSQLPEQRGLIAWFARNPVAANLLMLLIVCAGLFSLWSIRKEALPPVEPREVQIGVAYPGAAPEEVEDGVVARIEEALEDVEGIEELRAWAFEGYGEVNVELRTDTDMARAMDEIKIAVDSISTFPEEIERPSVRRQVFRAQVMMIQFWGDVDEATLKRLADEA
ncbi:MAG: efflux RND transporter permease subunit, partial [Pseudomonadales bacterium]|nr:efflux RND transporter permease subunit [Pseudomonadales bacterium]